VNRYMDVDESVADVFNEVVNSRFPVYANLAVKLVFDTKKKVQKGNIVLASIEIANEKVRFLTKEETDNGEGVDYILYVDSVAWENANPNDRKRMISHELRHIFIDEKGKLKLIDHDVQDFKAELALNVDDPDWGNKLSMLVEAIYNQKEDQNVE